MMPISRPKTHSLASPAASLPRRARAIIPRATPEEDALRRDLERLRIAESTPRFQRESSTPSPARPPPSLLEKAKDAIDQVLVADFFFVVFAGAWLAAGVATSESVPGIYETWISLWPVVFQPAIGVLMAGALFSGAVGWLNSLREENK